MEKTESEGGEMSHSGRWWGQKADHRGFQKLL